MNRAQVLLRNLVLPLLCATAIAGAVRVASAHPGEPSRTVEISARRFEFVPNRVELVRGQTVRLRLASKDVRHGFFQKELGIDSEFVPGDSTEIDVTPREAGTFTAICDRFCGSGHGGMKMTFVVAAESP
ncbi:MAG: cupredoxin domain-containing protein [Acidobacteriota bacterium]|nr:cupredoxin domain-containing protein [Acidobacteriota bacterium]